MVIVPAAENAVELATPRAVCPIFNEPPQFSAVVMLPPLTTNRPPVLVNELGGV